MKGIRILGTKFFLIILQFSIISKNKTKSKREIRVRIAKVRQTPNKQRPPGLLNWFS